MLPGIHFHMEQDNHKHIQHHVVKLKFSAAQPLANTTLIQSISEKLSRENYIPWKAQVLAAVRGARLDGFLDGSATAPRKPLRSAKLTTPRRLRRILHMHHGMRRINNC
jgi:hypothetical protein